MSIATKGKQTTPRGVSARPQSKRYYRFLLIPGILLVAALALLPMLWIVPMSVSEPARGAFHAGGFNFDSYAAIVSDPALRGMVIDSLVIAAAATLIAGLLALPLAYFVSRSHGLLKNTVMILSLCPLLIGTVVLAIGWMTILSPVGMLSQTLQQMGLIDGALNIMRTHVTVTILIGFILVPYIFITILSSLENIGSASERAAQSLGASKARAFFDVTVPQIMPGIVAGTSLSFILAVNAYPIPVLLGGNQVRMAAPEIYNIITRDGNWPQGTALAISMVALTLIISGLYGGLMARRFDKWRNP